MNEQQKENLFTDEDLSARDWGEVELEGASFVACTFTACAFTRGNLACATFKKCRFIECTFASVNLQEAKFTGCEFGLGSDGAACQFKSVDLRDAVFDNCNLNMCRFDNANLLGVVFRESALKGADFRRSRFSHTIGRGTSFASGTFDRCKMDYADLSDQYLDTLDFTGSSLCQANFARSRLVGAVMHEVVLAAADVRDADFTNVDLQFATISELNILEMRAFAGMRVSAEAHAVLLEGLGLIAESGSPRPRA